MFSIFFEPTTPANPLLLLLLTLVTLITVYLLIVVAEASVYQWMGWGNLRACIKTAAQVNTLTFLVGVALMLIFPKPALWHLLVFLLVAVTVEALWLTRIRPDRPRANWTVSIVANAVSYMVLILPPFLAQR
ncbi:MAG: hypothetical protein ACOYYS_24655 [Chloroflexota bacterium]